MLHFCGTTALSHRTNLHMAHGVSVPHRWSSGARSMCGSGCGAEVALRLDEDTLRNIYMASLVVLGGRSFVSAVSAASRLLRKFPLGK